MADPVIEELSALQRDTAQTFLVDVALKVYDPDADDLTPTMEYRVGTTGPWTACTAQTYDYRHTYASPLTSIPTSSPGAEFGFTWQAFFDLGDGEFTDVYVRLTVDDGGGTDQEEHGPLTVVTTVPDTASENLARRLSRKGTVARTPLDFLGKGLVLPFRRASRDFANGEDVECVRAGFRQILNTRASVGRFVGELPWRPNFGSKIWVLRHRANNPTLRSQAVVFVRDAARWEPRVEVTEIAVERTDDDRRLQLRVRYRVISQDTEANRVFTPEFEETITLAA